MCIRDRQGTAAAGHRNQIPIGAEAAAGGTENAAQNGEPQAAGSRKAAVV